MLFGDYNPAGRLPLTFYRSVEQLPPFDDYDIRHGRTYMAEIRKSGSYSCEKEEPLYPFGYGLSYTRFRYAKLKTSPTRVSQDSTVTIHVEIKNTGDRPGEEVAQLYIRDLQAPVSRPVKRLKGFRRLMLQPGESRRVTFTLPAAELAYWDRSKKAFVVEPGRFEIQIGSSSSDIRLTGILKVI
ncbi:MAG: Periplasmic beta-glucosidase precursor [bacterium ADurb.Bin478]|nr:MAG: Periplasmic beta-glucosidase precursor [bacterium ADurb.Bin478]